MKAKTTETSETKATPSAYPMPYPTEFLDMIKDQGSTMLERWLKENAPENIQKLFSSLDWIDFVLRVGILNAEDGNSTIHETATIVKITTDMGATWGLPSCR
jgi:hypothetical protein